jgi:hypothetical protein
MRDQIHNKILSHLAAINYSWNTVGDDHEVYDSKGCEGNQVPHPRSQMTAVSRH